MGLNIFRISILVFLPMCDVKTYNGIGDVDYINKTSIFTSSNIKCNRVIQVF